MQVLKACAGKAGLWYRPSLGSQSLEADLLSSCGTQLHNLGAEISFTQNKREVRWPPSACLACFEKGSAYGIDSRSIAAASALELLARLFYRVDRSH